MSARKKAGLDPAALRVQMHKLDEAVGGGHFFGHLGAIFQQMEWSEDEVRAAMGRDPEHADQLWHSFSILTPTSDTLGGGERLYRAHCQELLQRVSAGTDTRPPTLAEMAACCCDTSQLAPMTTAGTGLYLSIFNRLFPSDAQPNEAYVQIADVEMKQLERTLRRRLFRSDRRVVIDKCDGVHWGEPAPGCPHRKEKEAA